MNSFQEIINGEKPVLVDFFAEWCGPCKMMAPILSETKKELGDAVTIIKVDVDKNQDAAMKFGIQGVPTLMDFRTAQEQGTSFFYVLPFSEKKALVEYTLFSEELLMPKVYESALKEYITRHLQCDQYRVCAEEFGIIPMTNFRFPSVQKNMVFIGTAGGQTKASSGYTFRFIQKHSDALVASLLNDGDPFQVAAASNRFHFYDSVLLHILREKKLSGAAVFTELFKKNNAADVFRFLDNETSLRQELGLISTLPFFPFLKAGMRER